MPGSSDIPVGNLSNIFLLQATLSPASVSNATSAEQTFTVGGLIVGDLVVIMKPTAQAGLGIVGARVTAANTLGITFMNATASPIVPTASEIYIIFVARRENQGFSLPTAIT